MRLFLLSVGDQLGLAFSCISRSRLVLGLLTGLLSAACFLVALRWPSISVTHRLLSYLSFTSWWLILGILSSIGLGTGLQTFLLYLAPHVARHTLKATACGRADIKVAPYDTALWGASDSWSGRACTEFGAPMYPHFPGDHGGYFAVPLLHLVLPVLPEAMLWGAGTAIGELPPFFIARAARLSGEHAQELDEMMGRGKGEEEEEDDEGGYRVLTREGSQGRVSQDGHRQQQMQPQRQKRQSSISFQRLFQKGKLWLFSQGREFGFFTIVFLAAIPNPLFDLAGLTCGHFLVPGWKFFLATLLGKCLFKAPSQALMVALLFNAHSIELLEDYLDALAREQVPFLGTIVLPYVNSALDSARHRMAQGNSTAAQRGLGLSLSTIWSTLVVVMFCCFFGSIVTSTARAYLLHQQQEDLKHLQEQIRTKQELEDRMGGGKQQQEGQSTDKGEFCCGSKEGRRRKGVVAVQEDGYHQ